jgi:hypothetical protein
MDGESAFAQGEQSCTEPAVPDVASFLVGESWAKVNSNSMEPYRPSLRRRLDAVAEFLARLFSTMRPQVQEVRAQRMCPFCGLITPQAGRVCLECNMPLRVGATEP